MSKIFPLKTQRNLHGIKIGSPIFVYHKVGTVANTRSWVTIDMFDSHMKTIVDRGYSTVSLNDLNKKPKTIVITFDDGYENFYTQAYPILMKYGLTATNFLITNFIGDDVRYLNTWEKNIEEKTFIVGHLLWSEIQEMKLNGFRFESHTKSHRYLKTLNDDELVKEISESKAIIEEKLNDTVYYFSAPKGEYTENIMVLLGKYGYYGYMSGKSGTGQSIGQIGRFNMKMSTNINHILNLFEGN